MDETVAAVRDVRAEKGMILNPSDHDGRTAGSVFLSPVITADAGSRLRADGAPVNDFPDGATRVSASWLMKTAGFSLGQQLASGARISRKHFTLRGRAPRPRTHGRPVLAPPARQASRSPGPPAQPSGHPPSRPPSSPEKITRAGRTHGDARPTRRRASRRNKPPDRAPADHARARSGPASGHAHRSLAAIPVRYMSVDPATQGSIALQGGQLEVHGCLALMIDSHGCQRALRRRSRKSQVRPGPAPALNGA
jgi:hypothetical protein